MDFNKNELLDLIKKVRQATDSVTTFLAKESNDGGKLSISKMDQHQVLATDLVWMESELLAAEQMIEYADRVGGELEQKLAIFYAGDVISDVSQKFVPHVTKIGVQPEELGASVWSSEITNFVGQALSPSFFDNILELIKDKNNIGSYGLSEDQEMIRDTFKKFAEDQVKPLAEKIHREDLLIPSEIMDGLKGLGCFGLSIPQQYGGFQDDNKEDNMGMIIVTEELSRGSVGAAGSLITRPEIMSKALLKGGTEEQKSRFLPELASGEKMCAVAVTEPDFGSDVAGMKVTAKKTEGGWLINGVKTWCTFAGFADYLLVLVRTDSDLSKGHKGLSIVIAEKPSFDGHEFSYDQEGGGHIEGKAIGTIGYRGMHSFEVSFQDYFVPDSNLIGGEEGLGKGFYMQMAGFAGGRIQTAARANGVMQAAFEEALKYANDRVVFKQPIIDYQISKYKLVKMAAIIQACRQLTYHCAKLMDEGQGQMEASLIKYYSCKISEWVCREAMQLHGGMGYAEEFPVSRYYVDARVFSIFEGAEDVLALRVIIRTILTEAIKKL